MPPATSPYRVLGIAEGASYDEVRRAHRKLVRRYHPDRNQGDPTAKESFLQVQAAFESISPSDPDAGFDAERVVAEMQRAAEEVERRRGRGPTTGRAWQQIRVALDRPPVDRVRAQLATSRARTGIAGAVAAGLLVVGTLTLVLGANAVLAVGLGLALAAVAGAYAVQTSEPSPWAVETHWKGLRDLRWGVMVGWEEIRGVRETDGAVDLALTPTGARRVTPLVPAEVFVEPAVYRLPVRSGSRLVPAVRAQLQGGVRLN